MNVGPVLVVCRDVAGSGGLLGSPCCSGEVFGLVLPVLPVLSRPHMLSPTVEQHDGASLCVKVCVGKVFETCSALVF